MVHREINDIDIPRHVWQKQKPLKNIKRNLAFDSETKEGKVFLLYNSDGDSVNDGDNFKLTGSEKPTDALYGLLTFLNTKKFRKSVNWFYNLTYDMNAIIKFLPYAKRKELDTFHQVDYADFRISMIPNKEMRISKVKVREDGVVKLVNSVSYYDLAQFYNFIPLKKLAEQTNYSKVYVDDISQVNIDKYYSDRTYNKLWNDRCLIDCKITVELADKLTNDVSKIVKINSYKSKASIARRYVLENIKHSLKLPSPSMMDAALKAFHAGHIEACALGSFKNVRYYDINAAYPTHIANLLETNGGLKRNKEFEPDMGYSFYLVDVDYSDDYLSPVWYLQKNNNYHVTGKCPVWVAQPEMKYFLDNGYDVKILDARHIQKNQFTEKPFSNFIHDLYKLRAEAKELHLPIADVYKVITNAIFGVTMNANLKKVIEGEVETDLYEVIDGYEVFYKNEYIAGNMYNPVYGAYICASTRTQLFTDFRTKFDKILSINTDGVYIRSDVNVPVSKKMGEYSFEKLPKLIIMGNGRYFGVDHNNRILNEKSRFRSIGLKPDIIAGKIMDMPEDVGLELTKQSPVKLGESVRSSQYYYTTYSSFPIQDYVHRDELNNFRDVTKHVYFKTDRRHWFEEPNLNQEIWDNQFHSRPFTVDELTRR